jgi:aryl-alcohol dehydrogenase-like predicted oxidoreductase
MEYRALGNTGLQVSVISMGGLFVSKLGGGRDEAGRAVHRALELGVNYIDTAPGYLDSEEVLGIALKGVRQPYILSTKLGGRPQPFNPQDKVALRRSVEESLRLLGRETIDILMIHEPDRPGQYDWFPDWDHFHGPVTEVLAELKSEGLIRFTGLGGTTAYELPNIMNTGEYDVVLTAFNYSLLWQEALISVIPTAKRMGMGIVIGSPLQQGALSQIYPDQVEQGARWLSTPRREQFKRLYALVHDLGIPITELALRFVISNPDISTVLMGSRSVFEVEQNVRSVEAGPLSADVLDAIREIAAMVPYRPFEEPFSLPFTRSYKGPGGAR